MKTVYLKLIINSKEAPSRNLRNLNWLVIANHSIFFFFLKKICFFYLKMLCSQLYFERILNELHSLLPIRYKSS